MSTAIRRTLAVVIGPALLLMGCSGGHSKDADGAEEALEDYFHALANGDDEACDMETEKYREESNEAWEEGIDCPDRVKQAQGFLEAFEVDLDDAEFDAEVDGDKAIVQASYDDGTEETYGLVYDDDRWLVDSEGGDADASDEETELSEEEAQATADTWLAAWCNVQIGMTRDEAVALMGDPTHEAGIEDDSTPQLNWSLSAYDFTVFLDTDGVVDSFGGNYDSLGESDLAQLPCVTEGDFGYERSDAAPDDTATESPTTEEPSPTAEVGEVVTVGSWDIKVTKVVKNANEILANPNFYNEKPRDQYVLITYAATYNGAERTADVTFDLTWSFTSSASKVFDPAYQTTPANAQEWPYEARTGGTVEQQVLFDIPADTISGGILTVEADDENFNTVYADFPIK